MTDPRNDLNVVSRFVAQVLVLPIRAYQLVISPLLGPRCRFYPSCSAYAVEALTTRGPVIGLWLAGRRLLRCHPWNPGGVDDVPPARPHHHPHRHVDVAPSAH